jgi:Rrf2 family transcriptional regulator, nitric oxide-sensitive transcriptional repressor
LRSQLEKHAGGMYLWLYAAVRPNPGPLAYFAGTAMRLTSFSDYALRLLMMAAAQEDRLITIEEAAEVYDISRTHLMKIANQLTRAGFLKAVRGRSGGLKLGTSPSKIRLGDVIRATEPDFALVECFAADNVCVITRCCRLRGIVGEALEAFMATFDRYTLADLMLRPKDFEFKPAA